MSRTPSTHPLRRLARGALGLLAAYGTAQWVLHERRPRLVEFIAHRGGAASAPENTLAAFRAAAAAGVLSWELDVQRSRDGELVVFHDETLERTSDGRGPLREARWSDLARLDAGGWKGERWRGERIPTLREVVALADEHDAHLLIELKSPRLYPDIEREVVALLADAHYTYNSTVVSFDPAALARVAALQPALEIGLNYVGHAFRRVPHVPGLGSLNPEWRSLLLNPARVRQVHDARQKVVPWTVNHARAVRLLRALGVDGIISDRLELSTLV